MSEVATIPRDPNVETLVRQISSSAYLERLQQALAHPGEAARYVRIAITAVRKNPDLALLEDRDSVFLAIQQCATDGLLPDGREAAMVIRRPRGVTDKRKGKAHYQPMIGGFRKICAEHGFRLEAYVVYANDHFLEEIAPAHRVEHRPPPLGKPRGEAIGAWAVARHASWGEFIEVMDKPEIEHVRKSSSAGAGPWSEHWGEMARKTVGRRLYKTLPLGAVSEQAARIIAADDEAYDDDDEAAVEATPAPLTREDAEEVADSIIEAEVVRDDD
jgi:recombination protein RecT